MRRELLAVLAGGLVGTSLRLAIDAVIPPGTDGFPISTLIVNSVGAFVLGALVARFWPVAPGWVKAGLGPGLLGSFTTFSAVAVSLVSLTATASGMTALAYLGLTLVFGLGAAWLGLSLGGRITPTPEYEE